MLDNAVIKLYKQMRVPHVGRYINSGKIYHYQVPASYAYKSAMYQEKVNRLWNQYDETLVKLDVVADYDMDLDDLLGDLFDPKVNPDINPHVLERQRKEEIERIERDGVWGIVSKVKCPTCGEWNQADSVWGFIGDDWKESGYDLDVKAAALREAGVW